MPVSNNENSLTAIEPPERNVQPAPSDNKRKGKPYTPKKTLNLRMKEKSGIRPEWFVLILALIMAIALVIEYFGVYRRYEDLSEREAQLQAERDRLAQTKNEIKDIEELREWFNHYSYKDYDNTIVDRIAVLNMLENRIFNNYPGCKIQRLSLDAHSVQFILIGLLGKDQSDSIEKLQNSLLADPIVGNVSINRINDPQDSVNVNITLKDNTLINNSQTGGSNQNV